MSNSEIQNPGPDKPAVSGTIRGEAGKTGEPPHAQLGLFGDTEAAESGASRSRLNARDHEIGVNRPCHSWDMNELTRELLSFCEFGRETRLVETVAMTFDGERLCVPTYVNEWWTSKQRAAHSLHEISYRACFKPQLPRFFIQRLTQPGEVVHDPFMGRGTTLLEAGLLGRIPFGFDINPLSIFLCRPRFSPPTLEQVARRLGQIDLMDGDETREDLRAFYHRETLREVCALRQYLLRRKGDSQLDSVDEWIWMVALHTLTGHSHGFFSGYTMPPNQAVSAERQKILNAKRDLTPPRKHVPVIIAGKTRELLSDCDDETRRVLAGAREHARFLTGPASATPGIPAGSIALVVTSPPFLDVVDYAGDNWLRCWFVGVDPQSVKLTIARRLEDWQGAMSAAFQELHRILRPGGFVAFEVGEVRGGRLKLEEAVLPCGVAAGLSPKLVVIHDQKFTKTSHCWGQENNAKGTNTNRIVVFRKEQ
jgi:hypothetical protein